MLRVVELFTFLDPLREAGFPVEFVARREEVTGSYDKEEGLKELEPFHRQVVTGLGYRWEQFWRAEQVHGAEVARIESGDNPGTIIPGVDGLMTDEPSALLGIYVADCGVIWVGDKRTGAIALLHSGRKGTEEQILPKALSAMAEQFGTQPEDLIVVLGPCIRPPLYEVDIASLISAQAQNFGVRDFHDCGICTGHEVEKYYSYRVEKGHTGRMLGLLASNRK